METQKIKEVKECKPWNGPKGTVYYHNLVMENGDKINIGFKDEKSAGFEFSYELTGDPGQHEFTKAKRVQPERPKSGGFDDPKKQMLILAQSSMTKAVDIVFNVGPNAGLDHQGVINLATDVCEMLMDAQIRLAKEKESQW